MNLETMRFIREDKNLNQADLANILKTSQSNYSRWEKGTEFIPLDKLNNYCNYFNVSMDYALGLTRKSKGNGKHKLNPKTLGLRIKIVRKMHKLTQQDLAAMLNTTQSTISAYESGKVVILTVFALQICQRFDISMDYLCGRINLPAPIK